MATTDRCDLGPMRAISKMGKTHWWQRKVSTGAVTFKCILGNCSREHSVIDQTSVLSSTPSIFRSPCRLNEFGRCWADMIWARDECLAPSVPYACCPLCTSFCAVLSIHHWWLCIYCILCHFDNAYWALLALLAFLSYIIILLNTKGLSYSFFTQTDHTILCIFLNSSHSHFLFDGQS